jgi:hypothetical protein
MATDRGQWTPETGQGTAVASDTHAALRITAPLLIILPDWGHKCHGFASRLAKILAISQSDAPDT